MGRTLHSAVCAGVLQADELQQYATGHKALQEERRGLQAATKQHEEARSKAEVSFGTAS